MLRSMTGFGRCVMEDADWTQTWEIRSVNNRHLDLKWRLPLQARGLESRLERVVRRFAARGRMEITLTLQQRGAAANLRFDAAQASAMLDQVAALADLHGDTFEPDYNALFAIPTLWERESEDGDDEMEERLEEGLIAALEDWNESRETEGAALARDMTSRIAQMEEWVSRIDERAPEIKEERFAVLRERLSEALAAVNGELEEGRFLQEMSSSRTSSTSAKNSPASMPIWNACAISLKSGPTPDGALTSRFRSASAKSPPAATKFRTPRRPALWWTSRTNWKNAASRSRIWNNHVKRTDHQPRVRQFRGRFPRRGHHQPGVFSHAPPA